MGRFSEEKGIMNLLNSVNQISKTDPTLKFMIIGDGPLREKIFSFVKKKDLNETIEILDWINHEKLAFFLNQFKIIVLPSYTEGLPNIMLEAMACGTPVLATPVGAVPDMIKDGKTGFIMENNSPECISFNIKRAFKHPDLATIADNANNFVRKEFTFETAVKRYSKIIGEN